MKRYWIFLIIIFFIAIAIAIIRNYTIKDSWRIEGTIIPQSKKWEPILLPYYLDSPYNPTSYVYRFNTDKNDFCYKYIIEDNDNLTLKNNLYKDIKTLNSELYSFEMNTIDSVLSILYSETNSNKYINNKINPSLLFQIKSYLDNWIIKYKYENALKSLYSTKNPYIIGSLFGLNKIPIDSIYPYKPILKDSIKLHTEYDYQLDIYNKKIIDIHNELKKLSYLLSIDQELDSMISRSNLENYYLYNLIFYIDELKELKTKIVSNYFHLDESSIRTYNLKMPLSTRIVLYSTLSLICSIAIIIIYKKFIHE